MEESKYNDVMKSKTPVSWIEEISRKQGNTPQWDIFEATGETKSTVPRFKCVLTLRYKDTLLKAEALQRSKKEAKHSAAQNMLDNEMKLTPKDYFEINGGAVKSSNPVLDQVFAKLESEATTGQLLDSEIGINPIGELLELCDRLNIGVPKYDEKDRVGPPHNPIFECLCVIHGEAKSEKAKTKKQAKRRVAHQWIMTLRGRKVVENVEGINSTRINLNGVTKGVPISDSNLQEPPAFKLPCNGSFEECAGIVAHKNHLYQKMSGDLVNRLKNGEVNAETIESFGGVQKFLESLAQECKLTVAYEDFENEQKPTLSILSIKACGRPELDLVLFGSGDTVEIARNVAAREALDHIQVFAK